MLVQIEQLIHGVRDVSNAIAHDLRTPLAELRSRLEELTLTKPPLEQTFAELEAAVADVDRVIGLFNALLRLAEIDSGMRRSGFIVFDMTEVAAAAVEFYQPAAEIRNCTLTLASDGPAPVRVAIRCCWPRRWAISSTTRSSTRPRAAQSASRCGAVRASQSGSAWPIPARAFPMAEKPKVIERFYRGDASRGTPGVGLGLSLVEAVARLHGSALAFEDNKPGLRAFVVLQQDAPPGCCRRARHNQPRSSPHDAALAAFHGLIWHSYCRSSGGALG
jgi:signal transduction histidine kinase